MGVGIKHFSDESVGGILQAYFRNSLRCECMVPSLRRRLLESEGSSDVDKIMVKLFFEAIFQALVHCYRRDLMEEYERSLDLDVYIFMHGGGGRVFRPFIDGIEGKVVVDEGLRVVERWRVDFSKRFGAKAADELVEKLVLDGDFRHALSKSLTGSQWAELCDGLRSERAKRIFG